mmetsp:Transcript_15719/g.32530  ORF Transcript_15719/g.32530 Transcript_15719/m.32530 type:complete len:162 (+) Transcript_15719:278-763(+)
MLLPMESKIHSTSMGASLRPIVSLLAIELPLQVGSPSPIAVKPSGTDIIQLYNTASGGSGQCTTKPTLTRSSLSLSLSLLLFSFFVVFPTPATSTTMQAIGISTFRALCLQRESSKVLRREVLVRIAQHDTVSWRAAKRQFVKEMRERTVFPANVPTAKIE